ncbi:MAG: pantoate--beta-alanine ligase [Candidatus Melainabacteria bacterium]
MRDPEAPAATVAPPANLAEATLTLNRSMPQNFWGGRMRVIRDIATFQAWRYFARTPIAFVPTMGALHSGHLSLIRQARSLQRDELSCTVVVSIFVNPLQFGEGEDFDHYPRPLEDDLALCAEAGVDIVFVPGVELVHDAKTQVVPPKTLTDRYCGISRPGHFTGVATIVQKFFNLVQPRVVLFGEKDAQQLAIIQRMVRDFNIPVEILPCPTVRDEDGLAMSSRNAYITGERDRRAALGLQGLLNYVAQCVQKAGELEAQPLLQEAVEAVTYAPDFPRERFKLDYIDAVDPVSFEPLAVIRPGARVLVAARIGDATRSVRLIDNQAI